MESGLLERLVVELCDAQRGRFYGKYRGIVQDVDDPLGLGRIKAKVPEVLGDAVSSWALPCAPYAGNNVGNHMIPPADAGVWIEFEAGDPARPIWTGGWWGTGQLPQTEAKAAAKPSIKIIRTESGLMVSIDDSGKTLSISDGDGKNIVKLEVGKGQVTVKAKTKVVVEAPKIELVNGATHPVVFGDELIKYLTQLVNMIQTHTHPGQMAAGVLPVTPMVPAVAFPQPTPSLVSKKVTAG